MLLHRLNNPSKTCLEFKNAVILSAQNRTVYYMSKLDFKLDLSSVVTKQQQVINAVSDAVNAGFLCPGDKLPSVNNLSVKLNISRDTVFKAYQELKKIGLIESVAQKAYHITSKNKKVLLMLDEYSPYKELLYNSFKDLLPANYTIDLVFHHYNKTLYDTILSNVLGKYSHYIISPYFTEEVHNTLKKISKDKLLFIDISQKLSKGYSFVCQNFNEAVNSCLTEIVGLVKKYKKFNLVFPKNITHPSITEKAFKQFCTDNNIEFEVLSQLKISDIHQDQAYFVLRQKHLVRLLKFAKTKKLLQGKDIGIIAYNDSPLHEVIDNGITSISTDFMEMGQIAADYVLRTDAKIINKIIPTRLILRGSL
ncbi:MAG: GntR family transcriptional regulator [Bacteroidetes bacterium]|nr:MAG: GntR family transcriptional regulator [Bacteroidota bacterium]